MPPLVFPLERGLHIDDCYIAILEVETKCLLPKQAIYTYSIYLIPVMFIYVRPTYPSASLPLWGLGAPD